MKAREFAVSKGLAKPGKGKLSLAAHQAIQKAIANGQQFEDYANGRVVRVSDTVEPIRRKRTVKLDSSSASNGSAPEMAESEVRSYVLPEQVVRRDQKTVYGIDTVGRTAIVIGFDDCAACARAVKYCIHDVPQLPKWLGGGDALMERPKELSK